MNDADLTKQLAKLRKADHQVAAMSNGSFRSHLQKIIGIKLTNFLKFQVENAKGPHLGAGTSEKAPSVDSTETSIDIRADGDGGLDSYMNIADYTIYCCTVLSEKVSGRLCENRKKKTKLVALNVRFKHGMAPRVLEACSNCEGGSVGLKRVGYCG